MSCPLDDQPPAAAEVDIAALVRPGDTLVWGQAAAEPTYLLAVLNRQLEQLPAGCAALLGLGLTSTLDAQRASSCLRIKAWGGAGTNRRFGDLGRLDVLPVNYSAIPRLVAERRIPVDVALVQLAADGNSYNLGVLADYVAQAIRTARVVVAEVNDRMPVTFGDTTIEPSLVRTAIPVSHALPQMRIAVLGDVERAIGEHIARLIPDGATLEVGLGAVPDAALAALARKRDLGIHSGTIGDGVLALIEAGAVTNRRKLVDQGRTVTAGLLGTERLYRWAHLNDALRLRSPGYTHDPGVLAGITGLIGINTALDVDLSGQTNAETGGGRSIGLIGGHTDFMRGCALAPGGLGIVALPSTAKGGTVSRIVPRLPDGIVTTPRADAGVVVTEHGIADLRGLTVSERARALIAIAAPAFRPLLAAAADTLI